ncbi:MAG: helix-turn-helix domain-containing protein [Nitrospirae bacterium]|nr:helix-turn-helix domain-containing protein [Nitrospirota bacterium]
MKDVFLTYKDLAERWKFPINTLRIWKHEGKLKAVKFGRSVRFPLAYILELESKGFV